MPAEIAGGVGLELEHTLPYEIEIAAGPLPVGHSLQEHLRGHDEEHADDGRHQQTAGALRDESFAGAALQCEPHAGAGDDEQQWHAQPMREIHGKFQRGNGLGVRDVPAPADEQHAGVEEQQQEDRQDSQPVEEFVARGRCGLVHGAIVTRPRSSRAENVASGTIGVASLALPLTMRPAPWCSKNRNRHRHRHGAAECHSSHLTCFITASMRLELQLAPLICVHDVPASSAWYRQLLGCTSGHGGDEYERLMAGSQLILQLHRWDVEHDHGPLGDPELRPYGNGVLLWFELGDFDDAVRRAADMKVTTIKERQLSENGNWEFWLRDLDGYTVVLTSPLP